MQARKAAAAAAAAAAAGEERSEDDNYDKEGYKVNTWVKVFRINPEFRILRLTFH